MAIESEIHDVTLRRRKLETISNQSSSSDLFNNNNNNNTTSCTNENEFEIEQEDYFDADATTMDSATVEKVQCVAQTLPHDKILDKLKEIGAKTPILPSEIGTDFNFKRKIVWSNAIGFLILHICALIGVLLVMFGQTKLYTVIYSEYYCLMFDY